MTDGNQAESHDSQHRAWPSAGGYVNPGSTTPSPPGSVTPRASTEAESSRTRAYGIALGMGALGLGLLLGMGIGVLGADDQDAVDALSRQVMTLDTEARDLEQEVADVQEAAAADVSSARAEAQAQVTAENATQQSALDTRAAELDARESGLAQREDAVIVLEQQAADGSLPGDGVHLVGAEVSPGTYRASAPADCYWERRSGLSGDFSEIIANGLGAADATVTVRGSDVAFSSERCGTWSRIG